MEIVRIQFELPKNKADELDRLMKETGVQTKKELFNNALTLLKWAVRETGHGNSIASIDEAHGKYRELQMPILSSRSSYSAAVAPPYEKDRGPQAEEGTLQQRPKVAHMRKGLASGS
jgi:hypothetical protein